MTASVQVFEVSAAYQLMVLAAALDSGAFPPADRRILLPSVNAPVPETANRFWRDPALASLVARFDAVHSWNDLIAPLHPKGFRPRADDLPVWERAFRRELGIAPDDEVHLALESIQVPPARSILAVFATSSATVYAEGLMSYGPTRDPLPPRMANRIERVLHLDLVPGLTPLLLTEHGVPAQTVDDAAFRAVVDELAADRPRPVRGPHALLLGQYLAPLGLVSAGEEEALYGDLVDAAIAAGLPEVVYKPHPSAPAAYATALADRAARSGGRLVVETDPSPAEVLYAADPPGLVLGCFSTGLVTAARFWGIPTATAGTRAVLAGLPLFEDSNRVPLVLVGATAPHVDRAAGAAVLRPPVPTDLGALLRVVGYAMQPRTYAAARASVSSVLRDPRGAARAAIPAERLTELRLPGGRTAPLDGRAYQRLLARRERVAAVRAMGVSAKRRLGALAAIR